MRADGARLRTRLTRNLVGVALVSVLLLSGVNYVFARALIDDSTEAQLASVRESRIEALERGVARLQANVSTLAANPSVADALRELSERFDQLDREITPAQVAELEALYAAEALAPFEAAGVDVGAAGDFVPASAAGRYVQYEYIVRNPGGFDERDRLDDAGDGSGYSAAHAVHHPLLRELMANASMSDLLLVDATTREIVYSTRKRIDVGTNAAHGPYGETGLGRVVDELTTVAVGDAVVSDSWFYVPTHGAPVFFLAAAVRSGPEVVGAVVTEVPVDLLTGIITADQNWELLGLGSTGDTYVVGDDGTLRTDPRRWLEDSEDYLRRYRDRSADDQTADLIERVGSPVLLQTIDNRAIRAGLDGNEFIGTVTNHLGTRTLAASGSARLGELEWVVVAEQARNEADSALDSYLRRILLLLAVLLPAVALLAALLARNLTRPVDTLVRAADGIARDAPDVEIEDLGSNELGDLGRQLEGVASQLKAREQEIVDEERHIVDILTAVLPARLVDRFRQGDGAIDDILDTATVISITLDEPGDLTTAEQDVVSEIAEQMNESIDELMGRYDVERVRRSAGSQLFIAGLGHDDPRAADAAGFALAAVELVSALGHEFDRELTARAGLSAGEIATGVLGGSQLTFGVWGDPAATARALDAVAQPGHVLVDGTVADALGAGWDVGPASRFAGLSDDIDAHVLGRASQD